MHVTNKKLQKMVGEINRATDVGDPWIRKPNGEMESTPGALVLDYNIYGYQLQMICNEAGAIREQSSYMTAREMYHRLRGMYEALHITAEIEACENNAYC